MNYKRISFLNKENDLEFIPFPSKRDWKLPSIDIIPEPPRKEEENAVLCKDDLVELLNDEGLKCVCAGDTHSASVSTYNLQFERRGDATKRKQILELIEVETGIPSGKMEANSLGQRVVSIEMPRLHRQTIHYRDALAEIYPLNTDNNPKILLGVGVDGRPATTTLKALPHLIMAGASGSGKSVGLHTVITSILQGASPEYIRFYMADMKKVELPRYNGIPHMAHDTITEVEPLAKMLKVMVDKMNTTYQMLAAKGQAEISPTDVRHVIIIDEVGEILTQAGKNSLEQVQNIFVPLMSLLQAGRAAGFHVILATQRPEVKVIPGILKANIPSVIGLTTARAMDSKIVIDESGLEKLTGRGDALIKLKGKDLQRVQMPWIPDEVTQVVVDFWKEQNK